MQATTNLPQNVYPNNRQVLLVRTTKALKTTLTGLVIPQGTFGKVLSYENSILIVDFGLLTAQRLPVGSSLIQIVEA